MSLRIPTEIITNSSQETLDFAAKIAKEFESEESIIICLKGNLGTGKTTFVKGFCNYFGINPQTVKSPTYTYYRLHKGDNREIYHFDYYRLEQIDEMVEHELTEILDKENVICIIEWPEKIEHLISQNTYVLEFSYGEKEGTRNLVLSKK